MTPGRVLGLLAARGASFNPGQYLDASEAPTRYNIREALQGIVDPDAPIDPKTGKAKPLPAIVTADGKSSRSRKPVETTAELAADAVHGMRRINWMTLLCAVNADTEAEEIVRRRLLKIARRDREASGRWPDKLQRRRCECGRAPADDYLPDLVELAITELKAPSAVRANHQRAEWFGISLRTFERHIAAQYAVLQRPLYVWYERGIGHICYRLRRRRSTDP